jgi:hypothetical protein
LKRELAMQIVLAVRFVRNFCGRLSCLLHELPLLAPLDSDTPLLVPPGIWMALAKLEDHLPFLQEA